MKRKKRSGIKCFLFFVSFLFLFTGICLFLLDNSLLPPLKQISHMQCKASVNNIIDKAVLSNLEAVNELTLLQKKEEAFQINTTQINAFCAILSRDITKMLNELPTESIQIPLGAVTGHSFFANRGPKIPFTLLPMGAVEVDYDTDFSAAGINQINYKIWLHVLMEIKIVNPFYQETLCMERKIMLADLIFGGKVPDHYFQMTTPSEYLLTE